MKSVRGAIAATPSADAKRTDLNGAARPAVRPFDPPNVSRVSSAVSSRQAPSATSARPSAMAFVDDAVERRRAEGRGEQAGFLGRGGDRGLVALGLQVAAELGLGDQHRAEEDVGVQVVRLEREEVEEDVLGELQVVELARNLARDEAVAVAFLLNDQTGYTVRYG